MRKVKQLVSFFLFTIVLFNSQLMYSQVTTSAINGVVTDQNGSALPGANVIVIHVPSGTQYGTSTRPDGKYNLLGLRVGGPYRVTVSMVGYTTQVEEGLSLSLGQNSRVNFKLPETSIELKGVTITAERSAILSSGRTGAATAIAKESIDALPTINRRIEDIARLTPQYGGNYSFAGVDNRLNNMTIDGSYFNNSFGLAGQPGDRTGVSAISLDAIEQVQVNIAPYDVRQGNFVGAGINSVTKSGTNEFSGSAYYDWRDNDLVGKKAKGNDVLVGTFKYNLIGARIGGPIIKNKLFFFVSFEDDKTTTPGTTFRANLGGETATGNVTRVLASDLDNLSNFLKSKFNYDTGPYQGYNFEIPSTRFLAKLDFNINDKNKLSLRYTQLDSKTDVLLSNSSSLGRGSRRGTNDGLNFANSNYAILENIRSVVAELNSVVSDNMSNNLIAGYTYSDESRESKGTMFPFVDILSGGSVYTSFGFEPFTPNNELRYSSYQIQDNFSIYLANHNLTFGVSAEIYKSENVFFPGSQSAYVYNSLADFLTDANDYLANPNRTTSPVNLNMFQVRYNNIPGQEKPLQPLEVFYSGLYAQDEWQFSKDLKLTMGLRIDVPFFGDTGFNNEKANALTFRDEKGNPMQYNTGKLPDPKILWSPRIGFNWDVNGDRTTQLRGGTGIFTARPAYVWISNQIGNTGVLTGFEEIRTATGTPGFKNRPFNPDPNKYKPTNVTGAPAASYELALTDPDFKFPQIWRTNIGIDQSLPFGLVGTAEILYNNDVNGIYYINANLPAAQSAFKGADNRPRWTSNRINSNIANATVIKNQNVGYNWSFTAAVEKPFSDGLFYKLGYNYGEARNTIDPGSIAAGSFTANQISGDPNNPGVSLSSFTPGSRLFAALSYRLDYFKVGSTTISFLWDYFTPGPQSYTFSGDANGDGATNNDLLYIPRNTREMNFVQYTASGVTYTADQQAAAWEAYISQDEYLSKNRGGYAERNAVSLPMISRIDFSIAQEVYADFFGKRNTLQFRADILNFGNLLNSDWGVSQSLISNQPLTNPAADPQGRISYRLRTDSGKLISKSLKYNTFTSDVYRIQFSIRYIFN
ncbi:TonB-dependent receptor [bacterium]|nr:TonB-dependent receptor [bacterium]